MTQEFQEKFLNKTRYGILTTLASDGTRDPRVTLLVANHLDEGEAWVAFDGTAKIRPDSAVELLERLAAKYWDLSDSDRQSTVDSWKSEPNSLCVIELVPTQIRTQQD